MARTGVQKIKPIDPVPLLAIFAQMENMAGSSISVLTPAKILKFLVLLKSILSRVGDIIGAYNALLEEFWLIQEENKKLKRRLAKYENAHTPPRVERDAGKTRQKKDSDADEPKRKQGGQPGHRGTTASHEPDSECIAEFREKCECDGRDVTDVRKGETRVLVDFKVTKRVTRYTSMSATCVKCGEKREGKFYQIKPIDKSAVSPPPRQEGASAEPSEPPSADPPAGEPVPHPEAVQKTPVPQADPDSDARRQEIKIPKFGMYGMSVIVAAILFWDSRSVIRRIGFQLRHVAGVVMGTGTTFNLLARTATCLAPEMSKILADLLQSPYLHIDETTAWIGGRQIYIWIIATRTTVLYFPFSRHGAMVLALLATYTGIVISDGYKVYKRFKRRQRCWAHLLREARDLKKKIDAQHADNFYAGLKAILKKAQEKKAEGVGPEWHDAMNAELERLLSYYSRYGDLLPVINTIRNDPGVWFTFMLYSYVEPTNNWAEQMVREVVKQRIMRQTLQTVEGAMIFTTLLSCLGTWRLSGLDIRGQLEKYVAA